MKSLHIREVPEVVVRKLKDRARRHHRSLQGELMALLTEAAALENPEPSGDFTLQTVKTAGAQDWSREGIYED